MKPKNKFQQHIIELSKRLPPITEPQKRWAYKHCFDHIGKRNAKGEITCLECGHKWNGGNGYLADTLLRVSQLLHQVGSKCHQQKDIQRNRVFRNDYHLRRVSSYTLFLYQCLPQGRATNRIRLHRGCATVDSPQRQNGYRCTVTPNEHYVLRPLGHLIKT